VIANVLAATLRSCQQYPVVDGAPIRERKRAAAFLTIETLSHDIEQIRYLQRRGFSDLDLVRMIRDYERVLTSAIASGVRERRPLNDEEHELIGGTYGRTWNVRTTPRVKSTSLWGSWDPRFAESQYFESQLGICVIDDFLSAHVLDELRSYCLESTVWFANRYAHGRLGAFFREGFNCPLLTQIAEELRVAFPLLIGDKHRLLQLWGFKYSSRQPVTHAHADFAAVNLNFWLTPDTANLSENSGGLVIYDVEAPADWDFNTYNKDGGRISLFLLQTGARSISIPYRANRAVLFNSDLFHATQRLNFRPEYENRRLNITMLFGRRSGVNVGADGSSRVR